LRDLQALGSACEGICRQQAYELETNLSRAMSNLRDIMNNLHPQTLDILGLGAALEAHLERQCEGQGLPHYHYYCDGRISELGLSRVQQLAIYRIGIEAISNVIKHAAASRFEVGLELRDGLLVLSVEDNGRGFDCPPPGAGGGRGLNNLRERARAIGAEVSWQKSRFSSGTRFELQLVVSALFEAYTEKKG
jgi:signal transduction histidine kinase